VVQRRSRRRRGTGGIVPIGDGVWRVDVELPREAASPRRRRAHIIHGSREEAETELARLLSKRSNRENTFVLRARVSTEVANAVKQAASAERLSLSDWLRLAIDDRLQRADAGETR
jgi:hypothetical protein